MARENRVVELIGTGDDEVLQPYFDITLTGGLSGYDHIHADGHIHINTQLKGGAALEGFVQGEGYFNSEGIIEIETNPGS